MRFQIIHPRDVAQLQRQGAVVVDLRERAAYARGHVEGARNIPVPSAGALAARLDPRNRYILYCDHGGTSMELARDLGAQGFRVGSVVGGWNRLRSYHG